MCLAKENSVDEGEVGDVDLRVALFALGTPVMVEDIVDFDMGIHGEDSALTYPTLIRDHPLSIDKHHTPARTRKDVRHG